MDFSRLATGLRGAGIKSKILALLGEVKAGFHPNEGAKGPMRILSYIANLWRSGLAGKMLIIGVPALIIITNNGEINKGESCALPQDAVIRISTDDSKGSGFIVDDKGHKYIYTCIHVLMGKGRQFIDIKGNSLEPKMATVELSVDSDVARMPLGVNYAGHALTIHQGGLTLNESIDVYGDSQGIGTIGILQGVIQSIGPITFETDAGIVPGNSGGPMLNRAGKVIGISSWVQQDLNDPWIKGTRFEAPRRFAYSLCRDMEWIQLSMSNFETQVELVQNKYYEGLYNKMLERVETAINAHEQGETSAGWNRFRVEAIADQNLGRDIQKAMEDMRSPPKTPSPGYNALAFKTAPQRLERLRERKNYLESNPHARFMSDWDFLLFCSINDRTFILSNIKPEKSKQISEHISKIFNENIDYLNKSSAVLQAGWMKDMLQEKIIQIMELQPLFDNAVIALLR